MNELSKRPVPEKEIIRPPANMLDVLRTLFRHKWTLLTLCAIAGAGAVIIVLLLPKYYQATTTFLAVSPDQATPELIFGNSTVHPELYGNANDIDRLLTIAESSELVTFLVDSFDLYRHYDIERDHPRAPYLVKLAFFDLYEIKRTKRDALELSIEDESPERAAAIANVARERINAITQELIKQGQLKAIKTFEDNIQAKTRQLTILNDSLISLRQRYRIYNTVSQSESLSEQLSVLESSLVNNRARLEAYTTGNNRNRDSVRVLTVRITGKEKEMEGLEQQLKRYNEGASLVRNYEEQHNEATETLSEDQERLKQYRAAFAADIPAVLLVEAATVPIIKSRPKRTLIVLAVLFITFVLGAVGVLLFETYRDVNWRAIYDGR